MRKSRMKDKMGLFLGLGILILCMLCAPACAAYNYEGYPIGTSNTSGIVKGDVYTSCGDKAGLNDSTTWSYQQNTLVTNFTNVPTSGVKWAELKVGVWGGTTSRVGWAETKLNDTTLSNETLDITSLSSNVSCSGSGVYLIQYNCTDLVKNLNNGVIKATVVATPRTDLGTSYRLDSRIYGAVLIVVYENGESYTQYWINQGNLNLHKNVTSGGVYYPDLDANLTRFNGLPYNFGNASLTVGILAGDASQKDYLYFNAPNAADSPYNLTNPGWNITNYASYKLGSDNVANSTCDGISSTTTYFDLHTFNVKDLVNHTSNSNYAIFWRGHVNDTETEIYDPAYPGVNPNTESYVSPIFAVLKLSKIAEYDFSNDTEGVAGVDHHAYKYQAGSRAPSANNVPSTEFTSTEYNNIKTDDGTFQSDVTTTDGNFAAHRFVFNVTDSASDINAINVTWNGKGYHDAGSTSNGAYLYIWNYTANGGAGAYEDLANCDGDGTEKTLTGEKTANLSNYINNGQVIVLAEQKTADDGDYHSHIETDYVKLLLKP